MKEISQKAEFLSSAEVERCKLRDLKTLNIALSAESALCDRETERDGCSDSQVWNSQCIFPEETPTYWLHIFFPINKKRKNMSDSEIFPAAKRREPLPEMQGGIQYIAEPC